MAAFMTPTRLFMGAVTAFIAALILWGATTEIPPIPKLFDQQDKLEHFMAFGALALWMAAFVGPRNWLIAFGIAALGAIGLELIQAGFVPTRAGSLPDLIASFSGIAAAAVFVVTARRALLKSR